MSYKIFSSNITLHFYDMYYETKFIEEQYTIRKKFNIIYSLILTTISIIISICLILGFDELSLQFSNYYSAIMCFTTATLNIIIAILCILIKNNKFQEWLSYLNYMSIYITLSLMRFYFVWILNIDMLPYALTFIIEMIFRLVWFVFGLIDFVPGVYLQVLTVIFNFALFSVAIPMKYYFRLSIYTCILVLTSGLSYFFIKELKRSFFYNLFLKLKNQWYESIIDNMNSGFVSIKDNKIQHCNKTLLSYVKKPLGDEENVTSDINKLLTVNMTELFNNIYNENNKIDNFEGIVSILNDRYNEIGQTFTFLGNKDIEVTESCFINLEVFGRCYSSSHNVIDRYDFIFNDITRSKLIEQKNAEFKYKTLFLSKVAHEFKNPLLCISELVDQVNDTVGSNKTINNDGETISTYLKQIKAMSSYLIILVKDMDFFSQKNTKMTIEKKIEIDKVNLSDIINFCNDITLALIKKSQKDNSINFQVTKGEHLPKYIMTDEIKLKQVLINLLSNAVKYTSHGLISLTITLEENNLKFQIDDTGKGISDSQKKTLFIPFANEFDKLNKTSSGLGLSIVKELVDILGSKIELISTQNKGSSFWFSLQLNNNDLNGSNISEKTISGTHFNEEPIKTRLSKTTLITSKTKYNVIVVDDDLVIRQATKRLLDKTCRENNFNVNIIEASDGIECLNIYFNYGIEGKAISFILSDETMEYMSGSYTAQVLANICKNRNDLHIPFYILSAYENLALNYLDAVDDIFTKPLRKQPLKTILGRLVIDAE
jgi:signal transduction histidine kinase/CheY-like chemotaxis protein